MKLSTAGIILDRSALTFTKNTEYSSSTLDHVTDTAYLVYSGSIKVASTLIVASAFV
jgi:hypothetical protein